MGSLCTTRPEVGGAGRGVQHEAIEEGADAGSGNKEGQAGSKRGALREKMGYNGSRGPGKATG